MTDCEILCFKHCNHEVNIFCFQVPDTCPLCRDSLRAAFMVVPPFVIPSPFYDARKHRYALCMMIKPTHKDFLSYQDKDNLHIGISDSKGLIFDFSENGVAVDSQEWCSCLVISLSALGCIDPNDIDTHLWKQVVDPKWQKSRYDASDYNCFNFVLSCLNHVIGREMTKEYICQMYLIPKTRHVAKYISIFHDIKVRGFTLIKEERQ